MKMLLTAIAAASLIAASAWAAQSDPHAGHHSAAPQAAAPAAGPSTAPSHAHSMQGMDEKSKHEMCKTVMGHDMANKSVHEHSRDKGGTVMWPNRQAAHERGDGRRA